MLTLVSAGVAALDGDPESIRADGRRWRMAAMATAAAAAEVAATAVVDGFLGTESDSWSDRIRVDTADLLGHLATARDIVGGALVRYADVLEQCQQDLARLGLEHAELMHRPMTVGGPPDGIPPPGLLVVAAGASAARRRHDDAQRICVAEIDRAIALAPGSIPGVRPAVAAPGVLDMVAVRRPSDVTTTAAGLTVAARMSTQLPHTMAAPAPPDDGEFLDPQMKAIYREKFYRRCLAEQEVLGNVAPTAGMSTDAACGIWADSVVSTRENLMQAALQHRGTIEPLPELPASGLLGASEVLMTVLFSGCMEGSTAGCLFDAASTVFPFGKFGKIGKEAAEALAHADDVADGAKAAKKADDAGAAERADEPTPPDRPPGRGPFGGFSREELLAAGRLLDRNGLTKAGRGLQKHAGREASVFRGLSSGSAIERNKQGLRVLDQILSDPQATWSMPHTVLKIYDRTGRGVRFKKDGSFIGLLEPER